MFGLKNRNSVDRLEVGAIYAHPQLESNVVVLASSRRGRVVVMDDDKRTWEVRAKDLECVKPAHPAQDALVGLFMLGKRVFAVVDTTANCDGFALIVLTGEDGTLDFAYLHLVWTGYRWEATMV
jgi:hypothetical protein